jgi:hypothetical protein
MRKIENFLKNRILANLTTGIRGDGIVLTDHHCSLSSGMHLSGKEKRLSADLEIVINEG